MKIAIVGAGFTGLTAAYHLVKKGHQVSVFEKDNFAGGLASGFKTGGWYIDRFYHHIFKTDKAIQDLTDNLGLKNIWFWPKGDSPIFWQGKVYPFSTPLDLLKFSPLSFSDRLKTGVSLLFLKLIQNYHCFENVKALVWLKKWMGEKSWQVIWQPLMKKKFGRFYQEVKMTWMWARIHKRSAVLGYPQGGFQVIINKLVQKIKQRKGKIFLTKEIKNIDELKSFDRLIFTTATPIFEKISGKKTGQNKKIPYLGTVAILLELKKALTKGIYWLNLNDYSLPFLALIEQTNLIDKRHYQNKHIAYLIAYLEGSSALFRQKREKIFKAWTKHLTKINPDFKPEWVRRHWFFKEKFTQPVFLLGPKPSLNFKTHLKNVYLANMTHIYPWDRGVNYAVDLGIRLANSL